LKSKRRKHEMAESKTYSFFLGCVMPNRFPNVEASIRRVLPEFGIELEELEGASCCPAPGVVRSFDESTWLALASRNLALAEMAGHDLLTGCNGCYGTFKEALLEIREHPERMKEVQSVFRGLGIKFTGNVEARHLIELINEIGPEGVREKVTHPLDGIKVAVHYGCHLLKPSANRPWAQTQRHDFLLILQRGRLTMPSLQVRTAYWTSAPSVICSLKRHRCN
jgi:heterodisulfide reductase subunit B